MQLQQNEQLLEHAFHKYLVMLLLYLDNVVLFSWDVNILQELLHIFEDFCRESILPLNAGKTHVHYNQHQPERYLPMPDKGKAIEYFILLKYVHINIPASYNWGICIEGKLKSIWACCHKFVSKCNFHNPPRWQKRPTISMYW